MLHSLLFLSLPIAGLTAGYQFCRVRHKPEHDCGKVDTGVDLDEIDR
jgi:hypothetical protein